MIIVIYGTTGELIKLLPLLKSTDPRSYLTICTYQQPEQLKELFKSTGLPAPDIKIGQSEDASDLKKFSSIPLWFLRVWIGFFKNRRAIKKAVTADSKHKSLVVVHGDTFTTLSGSIMGKLLRLPVAHVEAGLRSHNWRHPFPEEINRICTSKIARLHFAPGDKPVENLRREHTKGRIVNTRYNTVLDSLRLANDADSDAERGLPSRYCLVSIHRNELLAQPKEVKQILSRIRTFADIIPIVFVDHPITKERIHSLSFDDILKSEKIVRLPKQNYFDFIRLLAKADCVITDSGGLQEEAAYLGTPCLVHRKATERNEGLDANVVLSKYDPKRVEAFCAGYESYRRKAIAGSISPTKTVLSELERLGYLDFLATM